MRAAGATYTEIAARLGVSRAAIFKRLRQAALPRCAHCGQTLPREGHVPSCALLTNPERGECDCGAA